MRRQFGTIIYSETDKMGKKVPRNIDCYLPQIPLDSNSIRSWPDTDKRKQDIAFEYQQQKAHQTATKGRIQVDQGSDAYQGFD